jgi:hypothetical protein
MPTTSTPDEWRKWYALNRWRRLRLHQLRKEPLCRMCAEEGRVTPAEIVDHIVDHEGNWNAFWLNATQSLCKHCHESRKRTIKNRGYDPTIGVDGVPTDPRHPCHRGVSYRGAGHRL